MMATHNVRESKIENAIYDLVIIGGGLAGISAAAALSKYPKIQALLIDCPAVEGATGYGGFARFSGAKFSPPPAGKNLRKLVQTDEELESAFDYFSSISKLGERLSINGDSLSKADQKIQDTDLEIRRYSSLVLNPQEMTDVINNVANSIPTWVNKLAGKCELISRSENGFSIILNESVIQTKAIMLAAGRVATANLLGDVTEETFNRGIDLGVRFEFSDKKDIRALRSLGADAKILWRNCRTFCLNYPGAVFRYPFGSISIPGGIVADNDAEGANFGILYRTPEKKESISKILAVCKRNGDHAVNRSISVQGAALGESEAILREIYPAVVVDELKKFCDLLSAAGLIDWKRPHIVHMPLIDWHWPVYGNVNSHRASIDGIWVVGDSAGHARGLLQAAISGILGIKEFAVSNGYATNT
jgi:uncharacterized FAD-dependent dehydrogenase